MIGATTVTRLLTGARARRRDGGAASPMHPVLLLAALLLAASLIWLGGGSALAQEVEETPPSEEANVEGDDALHDETAQIPPSPLDWMTHDTRLIIHADVEALERDTGWLALASSLWPSTTEVRLSPSWVFHHSVGALSAVDRIWFTNRAISHFAPWTVFVELSTEMPQLSTVLVDAASVSSIKLMCEMHAIEGGVGVALLGSRWIVVGDEDYVFSAASAYDEACTVPVVASPVAERVPSAAEQGEDVGADEDGSDPADFTDAQGDEATSGEVLAVDAAGAAPDQPSRERLPIGLSDEVRIALMDVEQDRPVWIVALPREPRTIFGSTPVSRVIGWASATPDTRVRMIMTPLDGATASALAVETERWVRTFAEQPEIRAHELNVVLDDMRVTTDPSNHVTVNLAVSAEPWRALIELILLASRTP